MPGAVLLAATTDAEGNELWITDGTAGGTTLLKDTVPGKDGGNPQSAVVVGGRAFFLANNLLWVDGTPGSTGTATAPDVHPSFSALVPFGGNVLFSGFRESAPTDVEFWISDGTDAGMHVVADVVPGDDGSNPLFVTAAGDHAFFVATTADGIGLWVTDGTSMGTSLVKQSVVDTFAAAIFEMARLGDRSVVFTVGTGELRTLWVSDGTPAGTRQLGGECPSGNDCGPRELFSFQDKVIFNLDDGVHGVELWQTDGTDAGTGMIADLAPGAASFTLGYLVAAFGGELFFVGCEATHGCEPWLFDPGPDDQCPDDPVKLAPGDCGCGIPDVDADGSGISDCLVGAEMRARIDALSALITAATPPKTKADRPAFKAALTAIRGALATMLSYCDAHARTLPDVKADLRKVKKAVKRFGQTRAAKRPKDKALALLTTLRGTIVIP